MHVSNSCVTFSSIGRGTSPDRRQTAQRTKTAQQSREEKSVPLRILPFASTVVLAWIELLPDTRGEDVFVPFVPASIDDLCHVRVVVEAFEARVERCGLSTAGLLCLRLGRPREGIVA